MHECLRLASQAPSGGNSQRWRWMIVADPDKKKAFVAERYAESFARVHRAAPGALAARRRPGQRMLESATYLADHMAEMPLLVIPCTLDQVPADANAEQLASLYGGIFPAIWSFQLALRSRGLGSALTTLHLDFEREIGEVLGIPDDRHPGRAPARSATTPATTSGRPLAARPRRSPTGTPGRRCGR